MSEVLRWKVTRFDFDDGNGEVPAMATCDLGAYVRYEALATERAAREAAEARAAGLEMLAGELKQANAWAAEHREEFRQLRQNCATFRHRAEAAESARTALQEQVLSAREEVQSAEAQLSALRRRVEGLAKEWIEDAERSESAGDVIYGVNARTYADELRELLSAGGKDG